MSKREFRPTEIKTPEFKVSYPSVFKPKHNTLSGKDEYVLDALFPKDSDITPIKKAIEAAMNDMWPDKTKRPKKLRMPLKDGDEQGSPEYADHWYLTLKSQNQPVVVGVARDSEGQLKRLSEKDFYGGCFARAVINAYAYDQQVNKGVSFGLGNIQKTRDGERFGGVVSYEPETDFDDDAFAESADDANDWG